MFLLYLKFLCPPRGSVRFMAACHQSAVDIDDPYVTRYIKALAADALFNEPQDLLYVVKSQLLSTGAFNRQTDDAAFDG